MEFIDLHAQRLTLKSEIDKAIECVLRHGEYILGPEVDKFEEAFGEYCDSKHVVSCANGTEALALALMAWKLRPGQAVFCPSFTFVATAQVIPWLGATPVFVDIDPHTYNMDPDSLESAIQDTIKRGSEEPVAVIAVDLFGQPANYPGIRDICDRYGLKLLADMAQSSGALIEGAHPLRWADAATTSFFPAKPLGCYGDGGAVMTNNTELAELITSLRGFGRVTPTELTERSFAHNPKYLSLRIGMNSRLDTLQAAILIEKLKIFEHEIEQRQQVARNYSEAFYELGIKTPIVLDGFRSAWAQYTIQHPDREGLRSNLANHGIPSIVYYPVPVHKQDFALNYPSAPDGLPVTEAAAEHVLSLPMHPYLQPDDQNTVIDAVAKFVRAR